MGRSRRRLLLALLVGCASSCSTAPELRPQTLLVVDTDLPVSRVPGAVPVAAMDTLRIDILDGATVRETRELVVGDPLDWPVSLGAVGRTRFRLRLFRASMAIVTEASGVRILEPRSQVTVDRLVDLGPVAAGVSRRRVLLTGECIGFAADLASGTTCLGPAEPAGNPAQGISADTGAPAHVGTWSRVTPVRCAPNDDPDKICVPGSFDIVGDSTLAGNPTDKEAPVPLRPVALKPFRMDRTEVTVGRVRKMLVKGWKPRATLPYSVFPADPLLTYCTFLGEDDDSADARPLNCVTLRFARELCEQDGGRLPTEAEWEHAARRGDGRPFPWGFVHPDCCTTSAGRSLDPRNNACDAGADPRPEPVGSHVDAGAERRDGCPGGGDVSADGILDLGGSLVELTSDRFAPVSECGPFGLGTEPPCVQGRGRVVTKSTDWTAGLMTTRAAFRGPAIAGEDRGQNSTEGFRCVYSEPEPEPEAEPEP